MRITLLAGVAVLALSLVPEGAPAQPPGAALLLKGPDGIAPASATSRLVRFGVSATGERFVAGPNEVVELVFPDGGSITLAPGTEFLVDSFEYEPASGRGRLVGTLRNGFVKVTGGSLNRTSPIEIKTPSGAMTLRNGSATLAAQPGGATQATLLFGGGLSLASGGDARDVIRPGFRVVAAANGTPASPVRLSPDEIREDVARLTSPVPGTPETTGGRLAEATSAEAGDTQALAVQLSSATNFAQDAYSRDRPVQQGTTGTGPGTGGGSVPLTERSRPGAVGGVTPGVGIGPGTGIDAATLVAQTPSDTATNRRTITQGRDFSQQVDLDPADPASGIIDRQIAYGKTTNRLFNSTEPATQAVPTSLSAAQQTTKLPVIVQDADPGTDPVSNILVYAFFIGNGGAGGAPVIGLDNVGNESGTTLLGNTAGASNFRGPFLYTVDAAFLTAAAGQVSPLLEQLASDPAVNPRFGSIFGDAQFRILQTGFNVTATTADTRADDNFLFVESRPCFRASCTGPDFPDPNARHVDATGGVATAPGGTSLVRSFSVDRFFLTGSLDNFGDKATSNVASNIRAFLPVASAFGLPVTDSGLLVVNPAATGANTTVVDAPMVHVDFALGGAAPGQRSTISATIGNVHYALVVDPVDPNFATPPANRVDVTVSGRTIGSAKDGDKAPSLFSSSVTNTAFGGGNPDLATPGRAGYLVLENYDPTVGAPTSGGLQKPVNAAGTDEQRYAYLRLAAATGSVATTTRTSETLDGGWAAGLSDFQSGGGIALGIVDSGTAPGNVTVTKDASAGTAAARFALVNGAGAAQTVNFGGAVGTGALVDDNRFAARTNGGVSDLAMVSSDLVKSGLPTLPSGAPIPDYQHVKWGFFFGDMTTTQGIREHMHMGTWVAGKVPSAGELPAIGTASYAGHSIGNVFNNGARYTAVGSFNNTWNFATRQGTVAMNFDGAAYSGATQLRNGSASFFGTLDAAGRSGGLQGSFFKGGADPAAAVGGSFNVQNTAGATYRAAGTFVGQK